MENDQVILLQDAINPNKKIGDRYKTGFEDFDNAMLGGFKDGDLVIISGKSGEGKTTFSQTLTYNLYKSGVPTLWFSFEIILDELHRKFKEMGMDDYYQVYVPKKNTTGHLKWIKDKIVEASSNYSTKVIFIDHIDFLVPTQVGRSKDNTSAYLKMITTELKSLAIELNVVIVCMAHLKKLSMDKEPDMEDIGYSAGIYQLADYVFMIHRQTLVKARSLGDMNFDDTIIHTNKAIVKIVKNRTTGITKILILEHIKSKFIKYDKSTY
jgi:replicative DNA helicase